MGLFWTHRRRRLVLTHLLGHLLHDVIGDVGDGGVSQPLEEVVVLSVQLHGADASVVNVRVQCADQDQEAQKEQR